jgi:uncharacterized protein YjbJ (UPF0337 family)
MDKDNIGGKLSQIKGQIKSIWGKLTDDDIALFEGNRDQFFGKVQEKYGIAKEEAEKRIRDLERSDRAA